jgi:hypothetical protein
MLTVTSNLIRLTPIVKVICSSETSFLTRATRYHLPVDGNFHSHRSENLKSYNKFSA